LTRREELEGFVEGYFGPKEELILPERPYHALGQLSQIRAFLHAVQRGRSKANKRAAQTEIASTLTTIQTLTGIAKHEMPEACFPARAPGEACCASSPRKSQPFYYPGMVQVFRIPVELAGLRRTGHCRRPQ
jgi:hypothetical protein